MSNIIDKIQLSGITYDIGGQGGSGVSVVEVTQAEYDALPSSAKTDTSKMYVITDAEAGDLTNYYTKSETNTLLGGKQATLVSGTNIKTINNESLLGSGNIDIQGGGGGKAIEAGINISITTGATADTINCTLPISAGTGTNSIKIGGGVSSGLYSLAGGSPNSKSLDYASFAWGEGAEANVLHSTVFGFYSNGNGYYSFANGEYVDTNNEAEHSQGRYNVSNKANDTWGDSGNTLFSVGNGTGYSARHNAFEIRQNGDIYLSSGGTDIKLQDHLGGGGGGGKAIEAGRGISVTTGATADTVSFNLPISAGTGNGSLIIGDNGGGTDYASVASDVGAVVFPSRRFYGKNYAIGESSFAHGSGCSAGTCSHAEGYNTKCIMGYNSHSEGEKTEARGYNSHSEGDSTLAGESSYVSCCHAEGYYTSAMTYYSHAEGYYTKTTNYSEHASGRYNNSVSASTTFGDSGNTLFSVGNGAAENARHNAFEIRQNGDIYCSDGTNDVKLQDTITATAANTTALGGLSLVKLTQAQYDALATKDSNTLYVIVN